MDQRLIDLYHRHVAMSFDRQLRFNDYLERKAPDEDWDYDPEAARLSFGKLKFEAPLVGTHSYANNSWLWAWSNKHVKLTLTNRALGDTVRMLVHRLGVHALAAAGFSLEPLLGPDLTRIAAHVLGIVLTPELGYNAYHLTPSKHGTGLAIIRDRRLDFSERRPLARIRAVFPLVVSELPVADHRAAFMAFIHDYGLPATDVEGGVKVVHGKDEVIATFDDRNRLASLEGNVTAEAIRLAKKPRAKKTKSARKPAKKPVKKVAVKAAARKLTRKTPKKAPKKR